MTVLGTIRSLGLIDKFRSTRINTSQEKFQRTSRPQSFLVPLYLLILLVRDFLVTVKTITTLCNKTPLLIYGTLPQLLYKDRVLGIFPVRDDRER